MQPAGFSNVYIAALIAIIPLIWIFVSMIKFQIPAHIAAFVALLSGVAISAAIWRMHALYIVQSIFEGIALGLWPIAWVIFAALFTYNISIHSGAMDRINGMLSGISRDRRIQVLIIAFALGGFLEATAGFGTSVAIPAGILISLGFEPVFAAVVCLVANTVPVAFGVVGIPVVTLGSITNLSVLELSKYIAIQLFPFAVLLPFLLVAITAGNLKGVKNICLPTLISGVTFAAGQTITVLLVGPELAAVVGSLAALGVLVAWMKLFPLSEERVWLFPGEKHGDALKKNSIGFYAAIKAWSPYIILLLLVILTRMVPQFHFLSLFPFEQKIQFYTGEGGKPVSFSLLTNSGSLIAISALIGAFWQGVGFKAIYNIAKKTLKQIGKTILTILCIISLSRIMAYSGMISVIAASLASLAGRFYPLICPLIGAIGTFLTGSDTTSNVLFGELQKQMANKTGLDPLWITAGNGSGATAGKMISPQSISIATSSTGLAGSEGKILKKTLKYTIVFIALMGILIYFGEKII